MATYVWLLPGFMGSTLGLYPASAGQRAPGPRLCALWGDLAAVPSVPFLSMLALPSPLQPTQTIVADGLVSTEVFGGYSRFAASLQANLPEGWQLAPWPYDWRLSLRTVGQQLAAALQANYLAGNTNIVVGHSLGALLAWAAWAALVDSSQQAALSRIITIGGALYGSGAVPGMFREQEEALGQLVTLQRLVLFGPRGLVASLLRGPTDAELAALLATAATWPAVYDMYPDPAGLDDPGDTLRPQLFSASYWQGALTQPNFATMALETTNFHSWLRTAAHVPPANMSVNVVGLGYQTPGRVQASPASLQPPGLGLVPSAVASSPRLSRLWQLPTFASAEAGDGRCTLAQQSWPAHQLVSVGSRHAAQQLDPATLVAVVALLTGPLNPPSTFSAVQQAVPYSPKPGSSLVTADLAGQLAPSVPAVNLLEGIFVPSPETAAPAPVIPVRVGIDP